MIDSVEAMPSIAQHPDKNSILSEFLLAKNDDDYSPFHLAVYRGNIVRIHFPLGRYFYDSKSGYSFTYSPKTNTILWNNKDVVSRMIKYPIDFYSKARKGRTKSLRLFNENSWYC